MKKLISHDVNGLMMVATQKDCKSLKEMILANPDAPLLIFVGDEANSGEYQYEICFKSVLAVWAGKKSLSSAKKTKITRGGTFILPAKPRSPASRS